MSPNSREYQGRIPGFPYSVDESWSMEWVWERDFDGFRPEDCLLVEAKARYDQFLDKDDEPYTKTVDDIWKSRLTDSQRSCWRILPPD